MEAVKDIYEQGSIKLLEPAPAVEQALVVIVDRRSAIRSCGGQAC